tara:strand:- start:260 stop:538 length:279 start_codon:yes stop_codon:yes gene_type:complete
MTECNLFPFSRFNNTSTNLKIYPEITIYKHQDVGGSVLKAFNNANNTYVLKYPLTFRDTGGDIKKGNIYSNVSKPLTKAAKFAYYSKFNLKR